MPSVFEYNPTPLVVTANFLPFLEKRNLKNQIEKRGNLGFVDPAFEAMMKKVGWIDGQAWCAYYIKIVLMQMFSFDREFLSKNLTGSSFGNFYTIQNLNKKGDVRYGAFTDDSWQVGDVFALKKTSGSGGHTGMVLESYGNGKVKTIEGNTNLKGSREGDRVLSLDRNLKTGTITGSFRVIGGFRRNFKEQEARMLHFDEKQQTFIFKQPEPPKVITTPTPAPAPTSAIDNIRKFLGL